MELFFLGGIYIFFSITVNIKLECHGVEEESQYIVGKPKGRAAQN